MSQLIRGWKKDEFSAPTCIFETDLNEHCKIVYLFLVSKLESDGQAAPGHAEIAKACSISVSTAKRATKDLHEIKLVEKIPRQRGPKTKDTNLYIINHPAQVGLISEGRVTQTLGGRVTQTLGGRVRETLGSERHQGVGSHKHQGSVTEAPNNMSVGLSVVGESDEVSDIDKINLVWKKAFGEKLNDIRAEALIEYGKEKGINLDGVIKIIKDVAVHIDDFKKGPYATILTAIKQGGWDFDEPKPKKRPARPRKSDGKKEDKLPKTVREGQERREKGEEYSGEATPEARKRIQEKLAQMRGRLAKRLNENN